MSSNHASFTLERVCVIICVHNGVLGPGCRNSGISDHNMHTLHGVFLCNLRFSGLRYELESYKLDWRVCVREYCVQNGVLGPESSVVENSGISMGSLKIT